jgi:hypothetical protein
MGRAKNMTVALEALSLAELLHLHASIGEELKRRGVCRTGNNPVADYTEWLVAEKMWLRLDGNSKAGYDATDDVKTRYQIKGRRLTNPKAPPQLSVIRNLPEGPFDYLIGVIYDSFFRITYAAQVPCDVVARLAVYNPHVNGHVMQLKRSIFTEPGVIDITAQLQAA